MGEGIKGLGVKHQEFEKFVPFGSIKINPDSLYHKNKLVIRGANKLNPISGFPPVSVSNRFSEIVMSMLKGNSPSTDDIHQLSEKEASIFDRLLTRAKLHRKFPTKSPRNTNIEALKHQLKLLEGEKRVGNNNPILWKELKTVLYALKDYGSITIPQAEKYMKDLKHYV